MDLDVNLKKISNDKIDFQIILLQSLFPVFILIGNAAINTSFILIAFLMLAKMLLEKEIFLENKKVIFLLFFFFLSMLINLVFSSSFENSIYRVIKIIPIIFFVISFIYINIKYPSILNFFQNLYFLIIVFLIIDLIFERLTGTNLIGISNEMYPSRLGSVSGNESNIGYFFSGFSMFFLTFFYYKFKSKKIIFLIYLLIITISFLIGERSSFIRIFLAINLLLVFLIKFNLKYLLINIFATFIIIFTVFSLSDEFKSRYYNQIFQYPNGIKGYFENSAHGAHFNVAVEIFKDNPYFGIGIKNFRNESSSEKYENLEHNYNKGRSSNHPHQIHFELLAETGLFGYISFAIFIIISITKSFKNFLKFRNYYQLSAILFISALMIPLIPTGSIFSTYFSSILWLNYAIMMSYNKY